jgi:hypothetical protein
MSNYLAIATVTAALRDILQDATAVVPGAIVSMKRPEQLITDGPEKTGVNVFLYQVVPNPAWVNADLPMRGPDGQLVQRPLVGLDLYYLLSFYGSELFLEPQQLLSSVVLALHARSTLTPEIIRTAIANNSYLAQSDLLNQVERIRFGPVNLTLEEFSRLWSVFFQVPYTLSVIYRASVVLLDVAEPIPVVKPVLERVIRVEPEVTQP